MYIRAVSPPQTLWHSLAFARSIQPLSLWQGQDKCEVPPVQMPIQDGTIPSSSFEWAVRDLPFCLSGSIYLPCETFTAVGLPFSTSASSAPLSAPDPTATVALVDPSHRWLFHVIENCFFPLVTRRFWMAHWANSLKQWQLWKQQRQEVKFQLLEASACPQA